MAIQKKADKSKIKLDDKAAEKFIADVSPVAEKVAAGEKPKKTPVALRFDAGLLANIDAAASRKGISRNAWISFHCAEALENE